MKNNDSHKTLHSWYRANGRHHLPWRQTEDPYHIWVSEIMLQQTQVKTVLERFYFPFLEAFPSVGALAAASEQQVLKQWQGLGYYSRARNLHKAAQKISQMGGFGAVSPAHPLARHGANGTGRNQKKRAVSQPTAARHVSAGEWAQLKELLLSLPGIGLNTAHAILAFGFHQPVPVMEANVKRILCRLFALENPTTAELWEKAEAALDRKQPFDYNQAMMDIGSMICLPKKPLCGECPLNKTCQGKAHPERYPQKKAKKKVPVRERVLVIFQNHRGELYLEKRDGKFLAGLYGFREYMPDAPITFLNHKYTPKQLQSLGALEQAYSHFTLKAAVYTMKVEASGEGWFTPKAAAQLPLSKADEKAFALIGAPTKKRG